MFAFWPPTFEISKDAKSTAGKILSTTSFMDLMLSPRYHSVNIKAHIDKVTAYTASLGLSLCDLPQLLQSKLSSATQDPVRTGQATANAAKPDKDKDKKNKKAAKEAEVVKGASQKKVNKDETKTKRQRTG